MNESSHINCRLYTTQLTVILAIFHNSQTIEKSNQNKYSNAHKIKFSRLYITLNEKSRNARTTYALKLFGSSV